MVWRQYLPGRIETAGALRPLRLTTRASRTGMVIRTGASGCPIRETGLGVTLQGINAGHLE